MSRMRSRKNSRKYTECPICIISTLDGTRDHWEAHMGFSHVRLVRREGNIFWVDEHEAHYNGRHYRPEEKGSRYGKATLFGL